MSVFFDFFYPLAPHYTGMGIALVQSAKGDKLLALLLLIVVTNTIAVGTVPALLTMYLSNQGVLRMNAVDLLLKLVIEILIPILVGMVCRRMISGVAVFTSTWAIQLSLFPRAI